MSASSPSNTTKHSLTTIATELASQIARQSMPGSSQIHIVPSTGNTQLFVSNGSRLHKISPDTALHFQHLIAQQNETAIQSALESMGLNNTPFIDETPLKSPPIYALSLAIAQKCNMGCTYCYADQGDFGGPAKNMQLDTAKASIDLLLRDVPAGGKVQLTFLGGEPLINRKSLQAATVYAAEAGAKKM